MVKGGGECGPESRRWRRMRPPKAAGGGEGGPAKPPMAPFDTSVQIPGPEHSGPCSETWTGCGLGGSTAHHPG
jgi:hypothetical protein